MNARILTAEFGANSSNIDTCSCAEATALFYAAFDAEITTNRYDANWFYDKFREFFKFYRGYELPMYIPEASEMARERLKYFLLFTKEPIGAAA